MLAAFMSHIEYRLLKLMLSPISGDTITVALFYFDGQSLRVAHSYRALLMLEEEHRDGIRLSIEDFLERARAVRVDPDDPQDLQSLFRVREGRGASLYMAPVQRVSVVDGERYFGALAEELRLEGGRA